MSRQKIIPLTRMPELLAGLRRQGKRIVFTNGCFDLLHYGHVQYLEAARRCGDILIVGLNSDVSIRRIKGPLRPLVPQKARAAVLAALACVDYVVIFGQPTPLTVIRCVKPDVLVKGADWKADEIVGSAEVTAGGGVVRRIRLAPGFSTTELVRTIVQRYRDG